MIFYEKFNISEVKLVDFEMDSLMTAFDDFYETVRAGNLILLVGDFGMSMGKILVAAATMALTAKILDVDNRSENIRGVLTWFMRAILLLTLVALIDSILFKDVPNPF